MVVLTTVLLGFYLEAYSQGLSLVYLSLICTRVFMDTLTHLFLPFP